MRSTRTKGGVMDIYKDLRATQDSKDLRVIKVTQGHNDLQALKGHRVTRT